MKMLFELFYTFAKIGLFTFGGGYAMLPLLERTLVRDKKWVSSEDLMDYYAVAQCTPGVIAVNTATFVGIKKKGTIGGIMATLGVIFPSIIIITIIALFINHFSEYEVVKHAFLGIRIAVCALVTVSVISLVKKAAIDIATIVIFIAVFILGTVLGVSPIILIIAAGISGVIIKSIKTAKNIGGKV